MRDLAWGKPSDKITIPTQSVDSNHLVIIQFFDSCQSLLSSRGLSNWFFSVFFFLMMTLNSLSNFIYLVASPNVANTISRITCFAPRIDPSGEAILLARVLLFKTAGILLLFVSFSLFFSRPVFPLLSSTMVTLVFNVAPVMFVTQINIVLRSFLLSSSVQSVWMGQVVLSGHSSLVLLLGLMSIFVSCGAYTVNHCVVARGPFQTALLFLYFVLTAHVATSDAPGLLVLQCVASMAMGVYVAIVPVYFALMMNVLLFTLAFATTCTGILRFEGVTAACAPLFVVGSGFLVGVILFYIVRLVVPRNCSDVQTVFNLAFTGQTTRAKQLLEALDSQALIEANPRLAVQLAFQLNAKTLADLLRHLDRVKFCEVYQLHFVYSCTSYYATIVNVLPDLYSYLVQERFDELKVLEKEFWRLVWLSHIPSMSKLACALGRRRYEFSSVVECVADRFGLQYAPDPKENGAVEHRLIFWCYFVSLLCCMLAQIILWLAAHEQEQELGGHELIVQFVGNVSYAIVETRLIRNDTTINANARLLFQVLQSEESNSMINGFLGFEMSGQTIAESFVDFMNCLPSAKFCGNLPFVDMVTIARANQSLYYSPSYMINQASFQIGFVLSQVLVLVTCVAIVVHMFLVDRRSITQEFKKFIAIPKSVLLRILHCQPPIDSLNTFPVGRQYYIWDILPAAIAFYATFLAAALANVCQCFSLRSWLVEDMTSKTSAIQLYGQMQNVQLLLASVYEGSISESWPWRISEFSRLDLYVQDLAKNPESAKLANLVPADIFTVISEMYLNKTVNADVEGLLEIMRKIDYILQQMALSMIQSRDMLMMKFLSQIALTLFLFGSLGWIMGKVEPLAKIELNEGNRLLRIAERMSGHELENLESEVVRHSKLPISLAVIDEGLKVNFVTENAEQEFGVSVAQHIGDSRLDLEVLNRIRRYSEKVNLEMSQCQFPEQQFTILLSPHYLLQNGQMRLARIVITKLSEQSQLLVNLSTAYNSLFYRAFPSLVKADVALPQLIPSSQKGTYLIILTLCGFHDWSLRAVPQVLMRFRREISDLLLQKCGTKEMFLKVIEHPETIVLMVNRDLPSSLFWCLLETCFNFSLELLSDVEAIAEKYGAEVQGRVMVFRCKDPDWYISDRKMALFDCCSDVVLLGLAMESKGQLGSVNYASQRKEMRVKNTTKLCDCFAADGTPFELSLVV